MEEEEAPRCFSLKVIMSGNWFFRSLRPSLRRAGAADQKARILSKAASSPHDHRFSKSVSSGRLRTLCPHSQHIVDTFLFLQLRFMS